MKLTIIHSDKPLESTASARDSSNVGDPVCVPLMKQPLVLAGHHRYPAGADSADSWGKGKALSHCQ